MPGQYLQQEVVFRWRWPLKRTFLFMIVVAQYISSCRSSPPGDPIKCSLPNNSRCTITNAYGAFPDRSTCHAAHVAYPSTEQDIVSIVAISTKKQQKMKVATRSSHSIPKLVCVQGQDGLLISTKYLNRVLEIDESAMTMTVESGMLLKDLINVAAKVGLALPYSPYWWGLTIGGLLGTGAHGSSLWDKGSAVHDYVVRLRIVTPAGPADGYAMVRTLSNEGAGDGGELNAAKVSLGVLGVISEVTLKLQPMFKRSISYIMKDDTDVGDQVPGFGRQHEFADLQWYPSQRKVVYRVDDRVSSNVSGNGLYDLIGFRSTPSVVLALLRSTEEGQELSGDANGICSAGKLTTSTLKIGAYGLTNNGKLFTGYPVVGFQNRLQASGSCLNSHENALITVCPWDPRVKGLFFHQSGISVALSKVKHFIQDIQKLVDLAPEGLCAVDLHNGILMRYVTGSNAYLGKEEDALDFDITYYRSRDPDTPRLNEDILEEIEQMAVFKYGGLPHWGKNRNIAFEGVINKYKNAGEFMKVKNKYDPLGLFSNEWTDRVLGVKEGGVSIVKEGCALEGLCICSLDMHCAPNKGYLCRPGKIFKDARVCSKL